MDKRKKTFNRLHEVARYCNLVDYYNINSFPMRAAKIRRHISRITGIWLPLS